VGIAEVIVPPNLKLSQAVVKNRIAIQYQAGYNEHM
jgi:hypothetical protein